MAYSRIIYSKAKQTARRKELRKVMTSAEARLWTILRNRQLQGRRFRRQHGIGKYIVDFCCPSESLVIELDGEVHNDPYQAQYDAERDRQLKELGFTVLRFETKEVFQNTEAVVSIIVSGFSDRL